MVNKNEDKKDDGTKTRLGQAEKKDEILMESLKTTQAFSLATKNPDGSLLTGSTETNMDSSKTKQVTNSDSTSSTRPTTTGKQTSASEQAGGAKSVQRVTNQTPAVTERRRSTNPASSRHILTGTGNRKEKKTKPKRPRKRKKKTTVNTGQPKIQIYPIDVPQPVPMLLSPKGKSSTSSY